MSNMSSSCQFDFIPYFTLTTIDLYITLATIDCYTTLTTTDCYITLTTTDLYFSVEMLCMQGVFSVRLLLSIIMS